MKKREARQFLSLTALLLPAELRVDPPWGVQSEDVPTVPPTPVCPGTGLDPPSHRREPRVVLPLPGELETKSTRLRVQWKGRFIHRNRAKTCLKKIYLYIFRANEFIEMTVKVSFLFFSLGIYIFHRSQTKDTRVVGFV